ncbi:hypothetical protein BDK92_1172 [Micromonospora pisi]|uniref:CopC domain-containing protein n=1 Tax=Micromonospora pisi TaxID=589240 RepID=A0A495JEV9_9ACTN|nr:copper resistance CopC family protein [Micromonospora pisi]RKR86902.1 hypothetical protein BDK92_1172 [Micromonospora pisi]
MTDPPGGGPDPTGPSPRQRWRGRLTAVAFVVAAVGIGLPAILGTSQPASLASMTPADGARLAAAPTSVVLAFAGDFAPDEVHVTVATAAGVTVSEGDPQVDGDDVRVQTGSAGPGGYLVAYHVLLDDGRSLSGMSRYTVDPSLPDARAAESSGQPSPAADAHAHVPPADPVNVALTCVAVVLVGAMAVLLLSRPRIRE